ncbi:aryl-sulfate sulfotransferase [candidate division KSB1 bacterium]|nr:aryl-sulfate sulfotransferase [candidate division KSB1 bacterium]
MLGFSSLAGQERTVGLFLNDPTSFSGYTLFAPLTYTSTYLIDNEGLLVHSWESAFVPGNSVYLLENGHLLRAADQGGNTTFVAGGDAGRVEEFDWEGNLVWEFEYSNNEHRLHHDIEPLPNGNVLMIA